MARIIKLGQYWGYRPEVCDGCEYLEKSIDGKLFACDAPDAKCVKNGRQVYKNISVRTRKGKSNGENKRKANKTA